jgi:hypothetical protein
MLSIKYSTRNIWKTFVLCAFLIICISQSLSQTSGRVDKVQGDTVQSLVTSILQARHVGLIGVDPNTKDLLSNYEEFSSHLLHYRARYRFHLDGASLLITMEDLQTQGKGTWSRALIPAEGAQAKLVAQVVTQLNSANQSPARTLESLPSSNPVPDTFRRGVSNESVGSNSVSHYSSLLRSSPLLEKARSMVIDPTPDTRCAEGLCAVRRDGLWGFVDYQGDLVLDFRYHSRLSPFFSNGICLLDSTDSNNRVTAIIFIDKKGNALFGKKVFESGLPFVDGVTTVSYVENGKKYSRAILDRNGQVLGSIPSPVNAYLAAPQDFHDGLIGGSDLRRNSRFGYLSTKMQWVVEPMYVQAQDFSDGIAWVRGNPQGGDYKWGAINTNGKGIIPFEFSKAPEPFSEGLAHVTCSDDRGGFVDRTGKLVIPCQYTEVGRFVNGHARVLGGANNTTSLIDKQGNVVVTFREAVGNKNPFAPIVAAQILAIRGDGLYPFSEKAYPDSALGLLDSDWNFVLAPYKNMTIGLFPADGNSDGLAWATFRDGSGKTVEGFINRRGEFILIRERSKF